ncbi:MAG: hypothetical protein KDK36_13695 [Leptospiraceae bacterium]|nr:hypothetical protein [Leptospiraceae bacterium]
MDIKKLLIGGLSVVLVLLVYTMFSGGDDSSKKKKSDSQQLTAVLLGGPSGGNDGGGRRGHRVHDGKSIFDSDFASAGVNYDYEYVEDNAENPNENMVVPVNPQTGKPYDNETMDQFEKLTLVFPGNSLIPKRMSKEEKAQKDQENTTYANATAAVLNKTASKEQVVMYYEKQEKTVKDRLEIIEYLIDAQDDDGNSEQTEQFQKILKGAKEQLENIEKQKTQAFQEFGI